MEIKILKKEEHYIEFMLMGEDLSIPLMIKERIINDKDVEFAATMNEHPDIDNAKLVVRTKKGDPIKLIQKTLKDIKADLDNLEKGLNK